MTIGDAITICRVAHSACGQFRADNRTPYYVHPFRVAELAKTFSSFPECEARHFVDLENRIVAAYLHDVLEDTKLAANDLRALGISGKQLDIVERLTKPVDGDLASYYRGISESVDALVVKCSDRAANLEDALPAIETGLDPYRFKRYAEKSRVDLLPLYDRFPELRRELLTRLERLEAALPAAIERDRQSHA
jgi:(p)ppGpp synthase/HD superfamily hydrolase